MQLSAVSAAMSGKHSGRLLLPEVTLFGPDQFICIAFIVSRFRHVFHLVVVVAAATKTSGTFRSENQQVTLKQLSSLELAKR